MSGLDAVSTTVPHLHMYLDVAVGLLRLCDVSLAQSLLRNNRKRYHLSCLFDETYSNDAATD
jgi:hypothetical protein